MTIIIIQTIIFITYISFLLIKFKKVLPSISDSWYMLKTPTNSLFTLFCFSIGLLMPFHILGYYPFLFFLSGAGLCFTGAATMFKDNKLTKKVHYIGAVFCILFAFLGIGFEYNYWLPLILYLISVILSKLFNVNNFIWWIEIYAFVFIVLGLLIVV